MLHDRIEPVIARSVPISNGTPSSADAAEAAWALHHAASGGTVPLIAEFHRRINKCELSFTFRPIHDATKATRLVPEPPHDPSFLYFLQRPERDRAPGLETLVRGR